MKFKVGKKYISTKGYNEGVVIKVTEIDKNVIEFKTIKGSIRFTCFDNNSPFAQSLEPYKNECIVIYRNDSETIALDKSTGKKAVAKCSPQDEYDLYTGAKLALERLCDNGVREVKRKAKAGEYVKVVNRVKNSLDDYENGDILKITALDNVIGDIGDGEVARYGEKLGQYLCDSEYVVLEGYQPEEEPEQYYNGKVVCVNNCANTNKYTVGKAYTFKDGIMQNPDDGITIPDKRHAFHNFNEFDRWTGSIFVELVE